MPFSAQHDFVLSSTHLMLIAGQYHPSPLQWATGYFVVEDLSGTLTEVYWEIDFLYMWRCLLVLIPSLYWHIKEVMQGPRGRGDKSTAGYGVVRQGDALRQPAGHGALLPCCQSLGTSTGSSMLWLHPSNSVTDLGWLPWGPQPIRAHTVTDHSRGSQ